MKNLEDKRQKYLKSELIEDQVKSNPIEMFQEWMVDAINDHVLEPNAMILATVNEDGHPDTRTVLLKEIEDHSFIFYTNYNSQKAKQIAQNPKVSLLFLWKESERQVRVYGEAVMLDPEKSTAYFQKRPRGSQIGAWVSPQSGVIPNRAFLDHRKREIENTFAGIPTLERPENWGGYRVVAQKIELWQGRDNRLHDRLLFELHEDGKWSMCRLAP